MFDIGFSEIVLLMFVGLVVLGPKRLPVAVKTVMGWVRTIRGLAANVQNELKQELKLQELQDSIKKAEQLNLKSLSPELSQTVEDLKVQAQKMRSELEQKAQAAGTTVEEQIKEIKAAAAQVENAQAENSQTDSLASSENAEQLTIAEAPKPTTSQETPETETDLSELAAHEQAELTERLSDYYPPDDVETYVAPKPTEKV